MRGKGALLSDFKSFLMRGNLIELAVAVVLGVAFAAVVTALVEDLITPLIAAIGGDQDFSDLTFTVNGSTFRYGAFINALLSFLIIAAVVFFLIVRPYEKLRDRLSRGKEEPKREYDVETVARAGEVAAVMNARAEDGWRVISVSDSNGGGAADGHGLVVVFEKPPAEKPPPPPVKPPAPPPK
jgi:large conductance mechanosensitive channel